MTGWLVVATAWVLLVVLAAGVGSVIYLGVDTVIRGWQLLEQLRRDREENR